ncbi:MAG: PilW family protein [Steroidobacterales bacterium]
MNRRRIPTTTARRERGMTLIEILVALAVTSFLLVGLFTIVQTMLLVSNNQNSLAQLQDNERLAMTRIGDVVQQTGYYTSQLTKTPGSALPAATFNVGTQTLTFAADQGVFGTHVASPAPQDSITVRYNAGPLDSLVNCDGSTATVVGIIYNTFTIDANGNLTCTISTTVAGVTTVGSPVILLAGMKDMVILYGVNTTTTSSNPVDSYITASSMTAANWNNVLSVHVSLQFNNPLFSASTSAPYSQQYPQQKPYIQVSRLIDVMNRAGVNAG